MKKSVVLSASDIERYCYCPLSWWLEHKNVPAEGEDVVEGERKHKDLSEDLDHIKTGEKEIKKLESVVMLFAIMATLFAIFSFVFLASPLGKTEERGIPFGDDLGEAISTFLSIIAFVWLLAAAIFLYMAENIEVKSEKFKYEMLIVVFAMIATIITMLSVTLAISPDPQYALVPQTLAMVWLIAATVFFYIILTRSRTVAKIKDERKVGEGVVDYIDDGRYKPNVLFSDIHSLSGRPDYILRVGEKYIPVEVKTGRVPKGPLFSHIMQLATYMLIIENSYGTPPYGILKYETVEHKIEYTEDLRNTLLEKIGEMRNLMVLGEVHRNHNRPGKCRNCSRRRNCPEKIEEEEGGGRAGGRGHYTGKWDH